MWGTIGSAINGAIQPVFAILFSGLLGVSWDQKLSDFNYSFFFKTDNDFEVITTVE